MTFYSDDVVTPGHSDHSIIMARLVGECPTSQINENINCHDIHINRKAEAEKFI